MATRKLGVKKIQAAATAPTTAVTTGAATVTAVEKPKAGQKVTHSYRLFSLLKKKNGTATTEQLAAAAGLQPIYVSWYMAELKRVYGLDYDHKRGEAEWRAKNLDSVAVPPGGVAGQRRNTRTPKVTLASASTQGTPAAGDQQMDRALLAFEEGITREFGRLRASLAKVRKQEPRERVASILQMLRKELAGKSAGAGAVAA